jgi:Family of unknown function (DUF6495)
MKFKRLSPSDLQTLSSEFINFLAANGIDSKSWESIKESNQSYCNQLIEEFSDLIYASSLSKIRYLMKADESFMFLFEMYENTIEMNIFGISSFVNSIYDINPSSVTFVSSEIKKYTADKELETFNLLESGCTICTPEVFSAFNKIKNVI